MKSPRSCLFGCGVALLSLVAILFLAYWFIFPAPKYIGDEPNGVAYSSTEFEFRYGHATRLVKDPFNKMQWVFGDLPDSITVDSNGKRLIVYDSHKAIIKSTTDSMEAYPDSFKHKGYMGIWDDRKAFTVDEHGMID